MSKSILTPFDIKGALSRNRFVVAPMTRVSGNADGLPAPVMEEYYKGFAAGGFGLVIAEGLYIDEAHSQVYRNQPGLANDAQAEAWQPLTTALRSQGALAFAQIMHGGALSQGNRFRDTNVAASAIRPKGEQMKFYYGAGQYQVPAPMTEEQIQDVILAFVNAANRAVSLAGFDGVEVHGGNGYLLDQFLTAGTNIRSDRWGGDTKRRVSLMLEVIKAIKEGATHDAPVGIRISQSKVNDFFNKWEGGEKDAEIIFGSLADAGADFLHVTEFEAWQPAFEVGGPTLASLAKRYAPRVPLIANGSLHDIARAEQMLEEGADMISIGRGGLSNPDLPRLVGNGMKLREFDPAILGPIANIKDSELELRAQALQ